MRYLEFILVFLAIAHCKVNGQDDYCYGKDQEEVRSRHYNSLTSYQVAHGTNMDKQYLVPDCEPQKVWILHRHGTRCPTKKVLEQIPRLLELQEEFKKNYDMGKTKRGSVHLCLEDVSALKFWKWDNKCTIDQPEYLIRPQGYLDLQDTSLTYKKLFPGILQKPYDNKQFLFRHTNTQRTTESFKAFAEGLFGENNTAKAEPIPDNDYFLRPYDMCDSWKEHDYKGPDSEDYKFKHSEEYNNTMKAVSERLGFDYRLENSDVELMYDMCRYEAAWSPTRKSYWCAAFLPEHVMTMEYAQDIHYYYKSGYGYDENSRLNCRLVKDMLQHLSSSSQPNAIAYFAHSTAVQTLITALGIAKDQNPLLASNYKEMDRRQWMSSVMDPFAANFLAVKYDCPNNAKQREHVIFFLNQKILPLDWCNVGLCSMDDVLKRYENFVNADCDAYYCRSGSTMICGATFATLLLAAIVYLIY